MNVAVIILLGVVLVIGLLVLSRRRETPAAAPSPRTEEETYPAEPVGATDEAVTAFPTKAAERSRCPACGTAITEDDESCPSCDISFVADGSRDWTPRTVGPADGIFQSPTEVSE